MTVPTAMTTSATASPWGAGPTTPVDQLTTRTEAPVTAGRSELDRDDFLRLLVAQLRYQDPLNPADGSEFVAQTAQLTSVEKLTALAATAERTLASQQQWSAAALVGRTVTVPTPDGGTLDGTVTSVLLNGPEPVLRVRIGSDTRDIALGAVTAVTATPATPPATTTG